MHHGIGVFNYSPDYTRAVFVVDQEISEYYRRLLPKYLGVRPQRHPAHITVVRSGQETPDTRFWGLYEGQEAAFLYKGEILHHDGYFYLEAHCGAVDEVRNRLGLSKYFDEVKKHHITIGNVR